MMFAVIDIRDGSIRWSGTEKECRQWIENVNPINVWHYEIIKL